MKITFCHNKKPKPVDCTNCKFGCSAYIPEKTREAICHNFWKLEYNRQKDFILMNVKSSPPKRRRPSKDPLTASKPRTNSKSFYLQDKRVCQSFFLKTLSISNGPLLNAFRHINEFTNFFDGDDRRGKHIPANKIPDQVLESIVAHIESFTEPHASKQLRKFIIDPKMRSFRALYNSFKEAHANDNFTIPSLTTFKRIFHKNNFSFSCDRAIGKFVKTEVIKENPDESCEEQEVIEEHYIEEEVHGDIEMQASIQEDPQQPKVLVHQIQESLNPEHIYEIQFILQDPL